MSTLDRGHAVPSKILINVRPSNTRVAYVESGELRDLKIEKAGVHGGFVEGSFKGKLILNPTNDPAPTLPFSARFRVKRDH